MVQEPTKTLRAQVNANSLTNYMVRLLKVLVRDFFFSTTLRALVLTPEVFDGF